MSYGFASLLCYSFLLYYDMMLYTAQNLPESYRLLIIDLI